MTAGVVGGPAGKISGLAAVRVFSAHPAWALTRAVFVLEAVIVPCRGHS